MFAFGETVTFLEAPTIEDDLGNEVLDWEHATPVLTKPHAGVEPRPMPTEDHDNRNSVTDGFTLYWPGEVFEVDPLWRATVRGKTWDVLGPGAGWVSPFTDWQAGTVVQVGAVSG